jgi:hypothetical protein
MWWQHIESNANTASHHATGVANPAAQHSRAGIAGRITLSHPYRIAQRS